MDSGFVVTSEGYLKPYNNGMAQEILREFKDGDIVGGDIKLLKPNKLRTTLQNNSIHLYCDKLAKAFNNGGYDMRAVFAKMSEKFFISWSMILVKQGIWHKIQKAMFDIDSTTKLDRKQVSEVYEHINRFTAEEFGVSVPFPDRHSQSMEDL